MKADKDGEFYCACCEERGLYRLQDHGLEDAKGLFLYCVNCGCLMEIEIINEQASRAADNDPENDSGLLSVASWPMSVDPRGGG